MKAASSLHGKAKANLIPVDAEAVPSGRGAAKVKDQPFFGMWSDREDMVDPVAYVRQLRAPRQWKDKAFPAIPGLFRP